MTTSTVCTDTSDKNLLAQRIVATPQAFRRNEAKAKWRKACFLRKQKCAQNKTSKIARIETVTKAKSVDKVIEELKAQEIKNQNSSLIKNEATTVQQQTYIPAQIKADGRINRQILGTVSGKEFVTERNNLMNVSKTIDTNNTTYPSILA